MWCEDEGESILSPEGRVEKINVPLQDSTRDRKTTSQTRHTVITTMQIHHSNTACFLMQTVDVLSDDGPYNTL